MEILVLRAAVLLVLLPALLLLAYNLVLALVSLLPPRPRTRVPADFERPRMVVVIPAHDEEAAILPTLRACQALDYPAERLEIVVVADNCTDATAEVVRSHGMRVLERHDTRERGKGFALRWAFDQLLREEHDAFVVLDADCLFQPDALQRFAEAFAEGHRVLQANYVVSNPDASPISYALAVGNVIENDLYYAPKDVLGLMVALRGTGMVFAREVLEEHPWGAYSIVEDLDYSMALYRDGGDVTFLPDVPVFSAFPESAEQLRVQRGRWAGGNAQMGKVEAVQALVESMTTGRGILVDMALTILSQSRPLQLLLVLVGWALALGGAWFTGDRVLWGLFWLANALLGGLVLYLAAGILRLGLSPRRLSLLVQTPWVVGRLAWIALRGVVSGASMAWERTPRA